MSGTARPPWAAADGGVTRSRRYAHGIAALALAAAGFVTIGWSVTTSAFAVRAVTIIVLGTGQSLVFQLADGLPLRYRAVSSLALLAAFGAAFVPHLLLTAPLATGPALALAAAGSLPLWLVAAWRVARAGRGAGAA